MEGVHRVRARAHTHTHNWKGFKVVANPFSTSQQNARAAFSLSLSLLPFLAFFCLLYAPAAAARAHSRDSLSISRLIRALCALAFFLFFFSFRFVSFGSLAEFRRFILPLLIRQINCSFHSSFSREDIWRMREIQIFLFVIAQFDSSIEYFVGIDRIVK